MEYKVKREYRSEKLYEKAWETDQPLDVDSIIAILKKCESETTRLYKCRCYTFSESGNTWNPTFRSIEELQKMKELPSPSIQVTAIYIDKRTNEYKFDISTAVNTNVIVYSESKKMVNVVRERMELELQLAKKREEKAGKN